MGIFINMKVADTVTHEEWLAVYQKSLFMAEKFGFFDIGIKNIHGENIRCFFPSEEMQFRDRTGWRVIGTFPDYTTRYCKSE